MATRGRLERQKYVGMWRWESELMAGMLSKFLNTVIMYMEEKSSNVRDCSSGSFDTPRRKLENCVTLPGTIWWW